MKRPAPTTLTTDQPARTRTKCDGSNIGAYTLLFQDNTEIILEPNISAKSKLLTHLASNEAIPLPTHFHSSSAHALVALADSSTPPDVAHHVHNLTPALYAMTLNLCDYLQMDNDLIVRLLTHIEPTETEQDPLSRLRSCYATLPAFPTMLYDCYSEMFHSPEAAQQTVEKILNSDVAEVTYYQLGCCDGIFSPFKDNLSLLRFAKGERQRRQERRAAAVAKTKELRKTLVGSRNETLETACRDAVWNESSSSSSSSSSSCSSSSGDGGKEGGATAAVGGEHNALSTAFLDMEMYKAIQEGRIDVAQRLLNLGATPSLSEDPSDNYYGGVDERQSTLMLATKNIKMLCWLLDVAGVDVNIQQSIKDPDSHVGGFNALWDSGCTVEATRVLLSRGIDPNQKCVSREISTSHGEEPRKESVLLHVAKEDNDQKSRLLIRYGADPNCFLVDAGASGEGIPKAMKSAYWPALLAGRNVLQKKRAGTTPKKEIDLEWVELLLCRYGANPNWPVGAIANAKGETPIGGTVLLHAVLEDNLPLVRLLLKYKANPNQYEKYLYDPSDYQRDGLHDGDEMQLYYYPPAYQHACSQDGLFAEWSLQCPLSVALAKEKKNSAAAEMVRLLKEHGATADAPILNEEEDEDAYFRLYPMEAALACKFEYVSNALKNDKSFMMTVVAQNYRALRYASDALKNDIELLRAVVTQGHAWFALYLASAEMQNDREFVVAAVAQQASALQYASKALQNDREIVMLAVTQNGNHLRHASESLKNDRDVVMVSVGRNGNALRHASESLKNDRDVVLQAVAQKLHSIQYASDELKNDKTFMMALVQQQFGVAFTFVSAALKNDKEMVLQAVAQNGKLLWYASDAMKNDEEVVLAAMAQHGAALNFASPDLQRYLQNKMNKNKN